MWERSCTLNIAEQKRNVNLTQPSIGQYVICIKFETKSCKIQIKEENISKIRKWYAVQIYVDLFLNHANF